MQHRYRYKRPSNVDLGGRPSILYIYAHMKVVRTCIQMRIEREREV